jgi:hypothetical protein
MVTASVSPPNVMCGGSDSGIGRFASSSGGTCSLTSSAAASASFALLVAPAGSSSCALPARSCTDAAHYHDFWRRVISPLEISPTAVRDHDGFVRSPSDSRTAGAFIRRSVIQLPHDNAPTFRTSAFVVATERNAIDWLTSAERSSEGTFLSPTVT